MLHNNNKDVKDSSKIGVSTLILRNWAGLGNFKESVENNRIEILDDAAVYEEYIKISRDNRKKDGNEHLSNLDKVTMPEADANNYSYAHCLHQSITTLMDDLIDKVDALQKTQVDIHHVEIITDRVYHNVDKLRNEVRSFYSCLQAIESRNKNLESKVDVLLRQNEALIQKLSQSELIYERFFSKNTELENKLLAFEHKVFFDAKNDLKTESPVSPEPQFQIPVEEEFYTKPKKKTGFLPEEHIIEENLDDLIQSKKQVEDFIKENYPEDFSRMRTYEKKGFLAWFSRVLGIN